MMCHPQFLLLPAGVLPFHSTPAELSKDFRLGNASRIAGKSQHFILFIIEADTVLLFAAIFLFRPTKHFIISFDLMDIQKGCNQRIHLSPRSVKYLDIQK